MKIFLKMSKNSLTIYKRKKKNIKTQLKIYELTLTI